MRSKVTFYHAGCPVCVSAEHFVAESLDPTRFDIEVVHLGQAQGRLAEAKAAGVKSVPAMLLGGQVFHINYGAALDDVK